MFAFFIVSNRISDNRLRWWKRDRERDRKRNEMERALNMYLSRTRVALKPNQTSKQTNKQNETKLVLVWWESIKDKGKLQPFSVCICSIDAVNQTEKNRYEWANEYSIYYFGLENQNSSKLYNCCGDVPFLFFFHCFRPNRVYIWVSNYLCPLWYDHTRLMIKIDIVMME